MESFKSLVGNVMQKSVPDRAGLLLICSQLEAWDAYSHDTQMIKSMGMHAIVRLNESELGKDEDMLRLYQIVGKHSRNMGAARIYDNLDTRGTFKSSLKFHLLWAESHAKQGDLKKFCEVIDHARNRLAHIDKTDLEAGFRDQADKYFSDVKHIFTDDEETAGIFAVKDKNDGRAKKSRRRSSLAVIQEKAVAACKFTSTSSRHGSFGENTKTPLRFEIIDRPSDGYLAPSIEEYRVAQMEAAQDMLDVIADVPMDITVIAQENVFVEQKAHPIVSDITASCTHIQSKILPQGDSAHATHEKESIPRRPRQLSTLEEVDYDTSSEEKRRRILSPKQAVKESTHPSSTNVNKSLQVRPSTKQPKSPLLTGSSFTEKAYNDLKAVFSDTVDLNKGPLEGVVDESTMQLAPKPAENFEVFIDSDVSVQIVKNISEVPIGKEIPEKHNHGARTLASGSKQLNERMPLQPLSAMEDVERQKEKPIQDAIKPFVFSLNPEEEFAEDMAFPNKKMMLFDDDEETMAGAKFSEIGIDKKRDRGIVTSTPAHHQAQPPSHDDFFAAHEKELEKEAVDKEEEEEMYAQSAFAKRRMSLAKSKVSVTSAPKQVGPASVSKVLAAERSMERALGEMNLADSSTTSPSGLPIAANDLDKTGIGLAYTAVTSDINPWDRELRKQLMKRPGVKKPADQHDYETLCPRISAARAVRLGGETVHVSSLIGQGGFAKVFKCTNEEGKTLALKYEVPSCPWEVYVCSEIKDRIQKRSLSAYTLSCIMQISDAYVFTNASVILNEYHQYGTLLDLSNKMTDPAWSIVLFLGIHMAKILREVHAAKFIHGDVKPDNFMIIQKISDGSDVDKLLSTPVVKLIDWGRAIDMLALDGHTFKGRAGTEQFDCPEMLDGRPWTYQTDFFGFVGTMHVVIFSKYADIVKNGSQYKMSGIMKRRLIVRDLLTRVFDQFLNISSCDQLPDWNDIVESMTSFFRGNFDPVDWRQAAARFNQCLPL